MSKFRNILSSNSIQKNQSGGKRKTHKVRRGGKKNKQTKKKK
jgi:hypothetical protein